VTIGEDAFLSDMQGGQYPPALSMHVKNRGIWGLTNGATVSGLTLNYA
jgi:hypothetical protein